MHVGINLLLFSSCLILCFLNLENRPLPGAVAQPSLWSLPRLPSSRFVGRNVTTAASTAVGETRGRDATAPKRAYRQLTCDLGAAPQKKGCREAGSLGGLKWAGQMAGHPPFLVRL